MTTYTEPKYLSDVLLVEVAPGWTKQDAVIAATDTALEIGTVLSKTDGIYAPLTPATISSPAAILATKVDVSESQQKTVVIARGATVAKNELIWPAEVSDELIDQAISDLEALGIVAQNTY